MKTTPYIIAVALLGSALTPAFGQSATSNTCSGSDPVGYLGISGIDCDCTVAPIGSGKPWQFRSEPKITSLEVDSRAGAVLKIGDVITHVDGHSIRTSAGANALSTLAPRKAVVLTVRRNGQTLKYAMTAESVCPTDTRLFGLYAPGNMPAAAAPGRPVVAGGAPRAAAPAIARAPYATTPAIAPAAAYSVSPRASFGMGLACTGNCSIKMSEKNGVATMKFSQPPEVYSVEKGGPADKAGIRRGDVLTHINDMPMERDKAGQLFANAKPGERVRFTIRRGSEHKTVLLEAAPRTAPMPALAQSSESLERARASLTHLQREQAEQMRKLQETLRESPKLEKRELQEMQRELLAQERSHTEKLSELARELSQAEVRMRVATGSASTACAIPALAPGAPGSLSRTLRYSGSMGDSEIEVRGSNPVSVTEQRGEVVITTGGTVVRVKKSQK